MNPYKQMREGTMWSFALLLIAVWSAFSFYWTGYHNGSVKQETTINQQKQQIRKLQTELLEMQLSSYNPTLTTSHKTLIALDKRS